MSDQLHFPMLDHQRYLSAQDRAATAIRERAQPPVWAEFQRTAVRIYPKSLTVFLLGMLSAVMLFSFVISAGKQVAASSLLFDEMPSRFSRLSSLWAGTSIVFMLLLSELGAVLFLVAAGTLAMGAPRWRGVNLVAWLCRAFAVLCAAYAIVANVSITLLDPVESVSVFQWLTSIGIPITVLGLGILLERVFVDALRANGERKAAFEAAEREYQALISNPGQHAAYQNVLADEIWRELLRLKATRDVVEPLAEADPRYRRWIVVSEYRAQAELTSFSLTEADVPAFLSNGAETPLLS